MSRKLDGMNVIKEELIKAQLGLIARHGLTVKDIKAVCGVSRSQAYGIYNGSVLDISSLLELVVSCGDSLIIERGLIRLKPESGEYKEKENVSLNVKNILRTAEPLNKNDKTFKEIKGSFSLSGSLLKRRYWSNGGWVEDYYQACS